MPPGPHAPPEAAMQLVSIKSQVAAALGRTRPAVNIMAVKAVAAALPAIVELRMFFPSGVTIIIRLTLARMVVGGCTRPQAQILVQHICRDQH
jgi:hypothetical protein